MAVVGMRKIKVPPIPSPTSKQSQPTLFALFVYPKILEDFISCYRNKMLIPKFIPLYPSLLQHYGIVEASILGYLDFFQCNNKDFNCTNEDLAEVLNVSESTIKRALAILKEKGEIEITKKIREGGGILRNISISKNGLMQKDNLNFYKGSDGPSHNIYNNKEQKELKESSKIPTPSELVEAYNNTPALVQKINNEEVVREFAVYKQSTKRTAYKTVGGFIQKLIAYVNLVSYGEIRYDVGERLRYAVNEARDNGWIQLVRDDKTERGYQTVKKFISMTKKQDEQ